jgi:hypothetical protein
VREFCPEIAFIDFRWTKLRFFANPVRSSAVSAGTGTAAGSVDLSPPGVVEAVAPAAKATRRAAPVGHCQSLEELAKSREMRLR